MPRPRVVFAQDDAAGKSIAPFEPARILVVEDDYLVASQMEAALMQAGFEVVAIAGEADEAIELAATHRPDLVVMDIRLRGERDGVEAALEVFRNHNIRSLFATAHQDTVPRLRAEPAHPFGWLSKPYTMRSLVEAVERAVNDLRGTDQ